MPKESRVEIPSGSGNFYRYEYDPASRATIYLGPVGSSPDLGEEEFLDALGSDDYRQQAEDIGWELVLEDPDDPEDIKLSNYDGDQEIWFTKYDGEWQLISSLNIGHKWSEERLDQEGRAVGWGSHGREPGRWNDLDSILETAWKAAVNYSDTQPGFTLNPRTGRPYGK